MSIRKAIIARYKEFTEVPIYSGLAPEFNAFPYCILTIVSDVNENDNLGLNGRRSLSVQIDVYASDFLTLETIEEDLNSAFNKPGDVVTMGDYTASYCRVETRDESAETEFDGSEIEYCRLTLEIQIILT